MYSPKPLWVILSTVLGLLATVATILAVVPDAPTWVERALEHEARVPSAIGVALLLITNLMVLNYMNGREYREKHKRIALEQRVRRQDELLQGLEKERLLDVVSGIPNQIQLHRDLERAAELASPLNPYSFIFIDLIRFGEVNRRFGYEKGDRIIEFFAQSLYSSMRRDEELYKMPFNEAGDDAELWRRAYRKYTGGDEFCFLLRGPELEAIGFLVRLQRRIAKELAFAVQDGILGSPGWDLSFAGAIIPIHKNDTVEDVFQRAHEGMRMATQDGAARRVFWASKRTADLPGLEDREKKVYAEAEEMFGGKGR